MISEQMRQALGFIWDPAAIAVMEQPRSVSAATSLYRRDLATFVWEAAALEGNPITFVEVKTILDGVMVTSGEFALSLEISNRLHHATAQFEALDAGMVRGTGTATSLDDRAHVEYGPGKIWNAPVAGPNGENLLRLWNEGVS